MKNSVAVTKACFDAYVRKDRAAIELLINDEFHFTSPLDNRVADYDETILTAF